MNVLFLSELYYPHGGGAEYATYKYAQTLADAGFSVKVVTNKFPSEPSTTKNGNLTIYRFPLLRSNSAVKFQMLFNTQVLFSSLLRNLLNWADLVYIPRFWYSAIPIIKAHKKPVLVHLHDYVPICPLSSLYDFETSSVCTLEGCSQKCIYKYEQTFGRNTESRLASTLLNSTFGRNLHQLVSLSDCIICVSKAQRDIVVDKLPQLSGKTEVIYNPLPNCTPSPLDGVDFGFLGGSNPIKGFQILQTALTELTQTNQHLTVHATNFASPPQTQQFTHAKILFYKRLNATELDKFYCNVRTLIFPSICPEPLPYAVTEAILRGRLVIASNSGGTTELAKDCPGVFLYPFGNAAELAKLMQQTAQLSTPQATELSQQNRAVFLKRFTNEDSSSCFIQCCKNLLL